MLFVLLLLSSAALSSSIIGVIVLLLQRARCQTVGNGRISSCNSSGCFVLWPGCWLAIHGHNRRAVQSALRLRNPQACSWLEGLAGEQEIFISPPVEGWTLVTGTALPEPWDDVDACFRFMVDLSRKVGSVQWFSASRLSLHHAWIKADNGRIERAYAWAGKTLWNQGPETAAEKELGLKCYGYTDPLEASPWAQPDELRMNVEKVPLLAARWGFDPRWIDEHSIKQLCGIVGNLGRHAGEASRRGWHI